MVKAMSKLISKIENFFGFILCVSLVFAVCYFVYFLAVAFGEHQRELAEEDIAKGVTYKQMVPEVGGGFIKLHLIKYDETVLIDIEAIESLHSRLHSAFKYHYSAVEFKGRVFSIDVKETVENIQKAIKESRRD